MLKMKLDDFLPYRLTRLSEAFSQEIRSVYKEMYRLNRPEWRVLASLAEIGPATATQIGAHSTQHKTKVSRAVFALEQRRWLTRTTVPEDRRNEMLDLTRQGREAFAALLGPISRVEADILAHMAEADQRKLSEGLLAMESALGLIRTDDHANKPDKEPPSQSKYDSNRK